MNAKTVRSLAAAFVLTALAQPAMAESLGEHPAVLVARTWSSRGIDPNTYIILPPAYVHWVYALPRANDEATSELGTGSESAQVALTQASARLIRDPVMMSPMEGVSFDIGAEHAVTYFLSDNGRCKLVLTQERLDCADQIGNSHLVRPAYADERVDAERIKFGC